MTWILLSVACQFNKDVENLFEQDVMEQVRIENPNILVDKSERLLYLVQEGEIVEENGDPVMWDISLGTVPEGHKQKEGDKKTPEGLYWYSDYNPYSSYQGSLLFHYPNPTDGKQALLEERISQSVYNDIVRSDTKRTAPPMNTGLGGYLLVHGTHKKDDTLFPDNVRYLYTDGCVGMSNNDIAELREYLSQDGALARGKILVVP